MRRKCPFMFGIAELLLAVLSFSGVAAAQSGPCTEDGVKTTITSNSAQRADDAYFFSDALNRPVVGKAAIAQSGSQIASGRKNQVQNFKTDRVVADETGNMAYEYGTTHLAFDDVKTGKHEDFTSAYLRVWKVDGGVCKVAAVMYQPEDMHPALAADEQPTADQVLNASKVKAAEQHKDIFLVFGASWCQPCHYLQTFLGDAEIRPILDRYFVMASMNVDEQSGDHPELETPGGAKLRADYGGSSNGVPFLVFLNERGQMIVNSMPVVNGQPKGDNIGYPNARAEIAWFVTMLQKAVPSLPDADARTIENWLKKRSTNCATWMPDGTTPEPLAAKEIAGFKLFGATMRQDADGANWLHVNLTTSPSSKMCVTKLEFEIVLGPGEHTVHATASDVDLQPGWGSTSGDGLPVPVPTPLHEKDGLISWKVTNAWGYPMPQR